MYFETDQVSDALLCKKCEGKLDIPKILPCGEIICSLCETSIQINDQMFDCLCCNQKHEMPKNGLSVCKSLLKILSIMPTNVSRGKAFDSLLKLLDEIQKKHSFLKHGIENSNDLINEYCADLRSDVQLTAEEVILQVNDISSKIIEEIDEYEKELIELNKTNSKSLDALNAFAKGLESFHTINTEYLKQHIVEDEKVVKSFEEATSLIEKAEIETQNLKEIVFDGKLFKFEKNIEKLDKSILGITKLESMKSLLNTDQMAKLLSLCEFPAYQKWNLIYKATKDGFETVNFHSKCDNKTNTLIIIKSTNDNVFGGYSEQTWNHVYGCHKADPNSFIFSLINKLNKPIKMKWSQNYGIYCSNYYGPTFGGGFDLNIADKSNSNTTSYSNLGNSYVHPDYAYGSNEAKSFLVGSYNFQVSEIEVYTKQ